MSTEVKILIALAVVLVLATLGGAVALAVRLVRARRRLRRAGVPQQNKWMFWGAMIYLVLPVDLLPDPVYLDDIGFLLLALRSMHSAEAKLPYALDAARGKLRPGKRVERATYE
jgi:uncharacterized membrane protein YkvA (DUF1232 family)